jgi:2-polyprenyl-3-methyl-5-hydroxy-6-metoxy-1,4-benzoquinol methylase
MATVTEHYAAHLAPIYLWMAGGMEAALSAGSMDLASVLPGSGLAVDLGAGFGMHSIPMARGGYRVIAVDSSATLLQTLRDHGQGLQIQTLEADLLDFRRLVKEPAQLIVCMGDTLTHLQNLDEIQRLCAEVARSLAPTGTFMATFRDYSSPAKAERRFIPVRSDADRILTCFLEESGDHMDVHDIVHEREGAQWHLKVSSYRKLRLAPTEVESALHSQGLTTQLVPGPRGMVRIAATRPA